LAVLVEVEANDECPLGGRLLLRNIFFPTEVESPSQPKTFEDSEAFCDLCYKVIG
jgi:hypothetical protein